MNNNGITFSIYKFALHDGPGIRTTVFLKGCPLNCQWCHNPESIKKEPEIAFYEDKCTLCGACVTACPNNAHKIINEKHIYDRSLCQKCGKCVEACSYDALQITGKSTSVAEIMKEVEKDKPYYSESGGGLTISGGEPMFQFEFTLELLKAAKEKEIHVCLDTCGLAPTEQYKKTLDLVDLYLFDYKASSETSHKNFTGVSNTLILKNFNFLYSHGADIEIRCPLIPGMNDTKEHLKNIAKIETKYPNIKSISIMPYHNIAKAKYVRYGYPNHLKELETTDANTKTKWMRFFKSQNCKKVYIQE